LDISRLRIAKSRSGVGFPLPARAFLMP